MLLLDTMRGEKVERAPSVPKIWIDLAANLLGRDYLGFFNDPLYASKTVIEAAMACNCDGARVFLFPKRDVRKEGGSYVHWRGSERLGQVDIEGGWATIFDNPEEIDFSDPAALICYQSYKSKYPVIKDEADIKKITPPSLRMFHELYGAYIDSVLELADNKICPIGDCNSGTLAFCVSMMGMEETLMRLYSEPETVKALIERGIELSITQAKFMLDKGIRVLRYNDSVANMNVISPEMWRIFVKPFITEFCSQVHTYCPGSRIYCHICGNIKPIVQDLVETGFDCIAPLDPLGKFSVGEIRQMVGNDFMLMGGVDTLSFINKPPEMVRLEAERCIREGFIDHRNYAVGSGCVVPRAAKIESLRALAEASRDAAK
jgi:uroporphyrinogen-III decarboxylase